MGLYQLLLPFLCTTSEDRACLQLRSVHRLVDIISGRDPYLPPGYSTLPRNYDLAPGTVPPAVASESTSAVLLCREMDGMFGDDSDNEDVFMPNFVIPRKQNIHVRLPPTAGNRSAGGVDRAGASRSPRTSGGGGGGGVRKVEKYDLHTGEVLEVYDNQSKVSRWWLCGYRDADVYATTDTSALLYCAVYELMTTLYFRCVFPRRL